MSCQLDVYLEKTPWWALFVMHSRCLLIFTFYARLLVALKWRVRSVSMDVTKRCETWRGLIRHLIFCQPRFRERLGIAKALLHSRAKMSSISPFTLTTVIGYQRPCSSFGVMQSAVSSISQGRMSITYATLEIQVALAEMHVPPICVEPAEIASRISATGNCHSGIAKSGAVQTTMSVR